MSHAENDDPGRFEERFKSLNRVTRAACHAGKGLITGIDGGIYLVRSGIEKNKPERVAQGSEMIVRNSRRIEHLLSNILYWAADREFKPDTADLVKIASEARDFEAERAKEAQVELISDIPSDLGSIHAEAGAIRAMLIVLIEAAIEMCLLADRKENHNVRVTARREADAAVFTVSNDGKSLDAAERNELMNPTFSSVGVESLELGYHIARRIVDRHGGELGIESLQPEGSRATARIKTA